jgi:hypothetical protein
VISERTCSSKTFWPSEVDYARRAGVTQLTAALDFEHLWVIEVITNGNATNRRAACSRDRTSDRLARRPAPLPFETSMARRNQRCHFRAPGFHGQTCSSGARAACSPDQIPRNSCARCRMETTDHSNDQRKSQREWLQPGNFAGAIHDADC